MRFDVEAIPSLPQPTGETSASFKNICNTNPSLGVLKTLDEIIPMCI